MKKSEYNFSKCLYHPSADGFLTSIQDIKEFKDYSGALPKKKLFTWIVVMYDLESPLRKTIANYYERKKLAAEVAGWETMMNGEFAENVTNLLTGADESANTLVVAYLLQFSMPEYVQLIAFLNMSYAITREIMNNQFDKDTDKTFDRLTERIKSLTNEVFGSGQFDEVMAARKALYEMAEKERLKLTPENVVKMITNEGGLPESMNPYNGYKPDKIKYVSDEAR